MTKIESVYKTKDRHKVQDSAVVCVSVPVLPGTELSVQEDVHILSFNLPHLMPLDGSLPQIVGLKTGGKLKVCAVQWKGVWCITQLLTMTVCTLLLR
ncbi:hypothetical protein E2C01_050321 [Portunus trituberculatus]|uniref:Uncharacterized protein n=1 Tax=Portunus trituberculatus TaxID=210409 RepID=A0A5B7GG68_PORTR|nr:hypothetical protein [Portunus trituberculatus]